MNYDFVVDTTKLDTLLTDVTEGTTAVNTALTTIFQEYEALAQKWKGDNFTTFITRVRGFQPEVMKCVNAFNAFIELVTKAKEDAGTLETAIGSAVSSIGLGNGGR